MTARTVVALLSAGFLCGALAGASGADERADPRPGSTPDTVTVQRASVTVASRLMVSASEFRLTLSRGQLPEGAAIVQLRNAGEDPHDLKIRRLDRRGRPSGPARSFAPIRPGELAERILTFTPGRYRLVCTLPAHARQGMRATLKVTVRAR